MSTTTCPYCNAAVPLVPPLPADRRVPCPRCSELVTVPPDATPVSRPADSAPPLENWQVSPRANRQLALMVVGAMAFMAAVALVYALKTVDFRRANDVKDRPPVPETPDPTPVPPAELAALGHLPGDTRLVVGVRLAAAREAPAARDLLAHLGIDPDGPGGQVVGLSAEQVDHVVLGLSLKSLPPRVTVALRARQPFDAEQVRRAVQAGRTLERNGKTLYAGKLMPKVDGVLRFPDDRTIVGALLKEHFDAIPDPPKPGSDHLPDPVPDMLKHRLDPDALIWAVAHVEADNDLAALATVLPLPAEEQAAWGALQSLAVGVRADGPHAVLTAQLRGRDAAATDQLGDRVERSLGEAGVVLRERERDGEWERLTAAADAETIGRWLGRFRGGAGK